eukprot:TRINITY_DN12357_c0_g1_i1.p1 TRINITY_DN12357_c0_g1~~TRINITY_DN12357_c0_g1_i1.p1  ORF type:complete len:329 (+),score=43.09 TRINITY_DN12357_c0_g1_i1:3-989(+)
MDEESISLVVNSFIFGTTMSMGLLISGMADPIHISNFFNVFAKHWDPSLLLTFATALIVHAIMYRMILKKHNKPLYGDSFCIPNSTDLDIKLVGGAWLFGTGWGLSGFCPGPSVVAMSLGFSGGYLFVIGMMLGFLVLKYLRGTSSVPEMISGSNVGYVAVVFGTIFFDLVLNSGLYADVSSYNNDAIRAVVGGCFLACSIAGLMLANGKILGISGLLSGIVSGDCYDKNHRIGFFYGLYLGGKLTNLFVMDAAPVLVKPEYAYLLGGFLVGVGTNLSNGCTSGHGICGLSRFSKRSIVATATFFVANIVTTSILYILTKDSASWGWQ